MCPEHLIGLAGENVDAGGHRSDPELRDDAPMRATHDTFLEVFRAPHPAESAEFRLVCERAAAASGAAFLQAFLVALNRDLKIGLDGGAAGDVSWAVDLCIGLTRVCPEHMPTGLGALVNDGVLWFHDPLMAV